MMKLGLDVFGRTPIQNAEAAKCWEENNLSDQALLALKDCGVDILCPYAIERYFGATVVWDDDELYPPGYFEGGDLDQDEPENDSVPWGAAPLPFLAEQP